MELQHLQARQRVLNRSQILRFSQSFRYFIRDIKIAHSIFALPFAASALLLTTVSWPAPGVLAALIICMVTARSFAMGINRFLDRNFDQQNLRTRNRMIPSGKLIPQHALFWSLASALIFIVATSQLSSQALTFSIPLLIILAGYSFLKRWTWATHWYLGLCLGLAPIAVPVALNADISLGIILLGCGVTFWVAGFDILYSLQDLDFDKKVGLHSTSARFGKGAAIWAAAGSFFVASTLFLMVGHVQSLNLIFYFGVGLIGMLLTTEILVIANPRLNFAKYINRVFFDLNAAVGVIFFSSLLLDKLYG